MISLKVLFAMSILMSCIGSIYTWLHLIRRIPVKNIEQKRLPTKKVTVCHMEYQCKTHQYCNKNQKRCINCLTEGQKCRRNKMCCRGQECASGKCRPRLKLGTNGALCKKNRDCNYGYCCAREKGESVCKPLLQESDKCGTPKGGDNYLWSHQCPCSYGLKCKKMKKLREGILELLKDWKDDKSRRCIRASFLKT